MGFFSQMKNWLNVQPKHVNSTEEEKFNYNKAVEYLRQGISCPMKCGEFIVPTNRFDDAFYFPKSKRYLNLDEYRCSIKHNYANDTLDITFKDYEAGLDGNLKHTEYVVNYKKEIEAWIAEIKEYLKEHESERLANTDVKKLRQDLGIPVFESYEEKIKEVFPDAKTPSDFENMQDMPNWAQTNFEQDCKNSDELRDKVYFNNLNGKLVSSLCEIKNGDLKGLVISLERANPGVSLDRFAFFEYAGKVEHDTSSVCRKGVVRAMNERVDKKLVEFLDNLQKNNEESMLYNLASVSAINWMQKRGQERWLEQETSILQDCMKKFIENQVDKVVQKYKPVFQDKELENEFGMSDRVWWAFNKIEVKKDRICATYRDDIKNALQKGLETNNFEELKTLVSCNTPEQQKGIQDVISNVKEYNRVVKQYMNWDKESVNSKEEAKEKVALRYKNNGNNKEMEMSM